MLKIALVGVAVAWLGLVAASWADAAETDGRGPGVAAGRPYGAASPSSGDRAPASARDGQAGSGVDDDYNFNWLDPDKRIYVLQNRRYGKAGRILLSALVGPGFSNSYRSTLNFDPRLAYYFSESLGLEAFYTFTSNSENKTFEALKQSAPNTLPVVREIRSQMGVMGHWVPWYAKINVFNKILYFDWYFAGGAGSVRAALDTRAKASADPSYVNQDLFAFYLGTGHQYHLGDNVVVRLDFTSAIYRAQVFGNSGDSAWYSNNNFGIGLGLKL